MESIFEVVCGIVNYKGRILATRVAPYKRNAGLYEFPGGKVEDREELEEALHRELKEELGLDVQVHHRFYTIEEGDMLLHAFFCSASSLSLTLTDHDEAQWLEPSELLALNWVPADRKLVEKLLQGDI